MWEWLKERLADLLGFAFGLGLLVNLCLILAWGRVMIYEDIPAVLIAEIVIVTGGCVLFLERMIKER